jgi:glycosyltransferase involved in cell wall biosynthesis
MVAFPKILEVSDALRSAPLVLKEKDIATGLRALDADTLRFIRRNRVRTVYLTDRHYWSPAYALFRACGVKSIILHDHVPGERPTPGHLRLWVKRSRYRMKPAAANLYLGVSKFVRDRFTRIGGVPSELCTYVYNGVSPTPSRGLKDVREVFGLPHRARVVISVGRAHPYKGIPFILACAEELILGDNREDVFFLHLGDGPELERLREEARSRGLAARFLLPGRRTDVPLLLPSCQMAFHASHGEAFSWPFSNSWPLASPPSCPTTVEIRKRYCTGRRDSCIHPAITGRRWRSSGTSWITPTRQWRWERRPGIGPRGSSRWKRWTGGSSPR